MPISNSIFRVAFFIAAALCTVILAFVFDLSIRRYDYFAGVAFQNKSVNFSVPPPRGIIFDRLGRPLVTNEPIFNLLVISREAREAVDDGSVDKVADILNRNRNEFKTFILEGVNNNSVFFVESGLSKDQVLKIKILDFKGFYVMPNTKRQYVDGSQFSQVLGYVGKVSRNELNDGNYYYPTDIIGRLGIEAQYEEYLRGEHGRIFFQYDNKSLSVDPVIGNSVVLNIDFDMQKRLFNELFNVLKDSSYSKATAVVQHPQTGAVLAMASFPTYDNNLFVEGLSEEQFKSLFENKSRPLFNRAISGLYNPGSTIKPFMGLMTLEENIFSPSDTIRDCVGLTIVNPYNPDDIYTFSNWRVEYGLFNLQRAIANSCNVYFYIAGGGYGSIKGLGVEKIANYLKSALADSKLGIDLPGEEDGFVPTPDWKLAVRGEGWYQGDTYNISIGQGDLLVTPLWLNSYVSAIANGGTLYKPFVAKQILDSNKNLIKAFEPEALGRLGFKEETINEVKNAMLETTISGTAKVLGALPVKSGAKTGTAEVIKGRTINSIMTAFAPFDNPEVNITVLIEGGTSTNEGLAVRATYGFLKWYFEEYQKTE
jgi:penicillin-binding protein 2